MVEGLQNLDLSLEAVPILNLLSSYNFNCPLLLGFFMNDCLHFSIGSFAQRLCHSVSGDGCTYLFILDVIHVCNVTLVLDDKGRLSYEEIATCCLSFNHI